jgi:hypothetical protein
VTPAPGHLGVRGRFGDRARPRAWIVDPARARRALAAAGAAAGAAAVFGLAAAGRRRRA